MSNVDWMTRDELAQVQRALEGPWNRPAPEADVHRALAWFPDPALVDWFLRGDGFSSAGVTGLSLRDALSWRKQLLLRDLPSPLSSADQFLPLIRCDAGFLIYDGKARGVALRRTQQPERYARALESALGLRALLGELEPAYEVPARDDDDEYDDEYEEEEDGDAEEPHEPEHHLDRIARHHGWARREVDASALWDDELLTEWFARVGEQRQALLGDLTALPLREALVLRDELEERATPALRARLHHLQWMPLLELPGRHLLLAWKGHGVQLHVFHDGAWQAAAWTREQSLEALLEALSAWCEPREAPLRERALDLGNTLYELAEAFDEALATREVPVERLVGFSEGTAAVLERWARAVPAQPFTDAGERLISLDTLDAGSIIAPLLAGADGLEVCAVEGSGVVLRHGAARLPWAVSVSAWVHALKDAAEQRAPTDVQVTRNFVGQYRVELPLLPWELARGLEQLTDEWHVDPDEFGFALGDEARVDVRHFKPVLVLDEPARRELIALLDAQREPELHLEAWSMTLVFGPLA